MIHPGRAGRKHPRKCDRRPSGANAVMLPVESSGRAPQIAGHIVQSLGDRFETAQFLMRLSPTERRRDWFEILDIVLQVIRKFAQAFGHVARGMKITRSQRGLDGCCHIVGSYCLSAHTFPCRGAMGMRRRQSNQFGGRSVCPPGLMHRFVVPTLGRRSDRSHRCHPGSQHCKRLHDIPVCSMNRQSRRPETERACRRSSNRSAILTHLTPPGTSGRGRPAFHWSFETKRKNLDDVV